MSSLPVSSLELKGGCLCSAIRYKITIPEFTSRSLIPEALSTAQISKCENRNEKEKDGSRFPLIDLDHCTSCRRSCGGLIQCWFICPQDWVSFTIQRRKGKISEQWVGRWDDGYEFGDEWAGRPYTCAQVVKPASESGSILRYETPLSEYVSSPDTHRTFCTRCGTGLTFFYGGDCGPEWDCGPIVNIAVGTLDKESIELEGVRPGWHAQWKYGIDWIKKLVSEGDGGLIQRPDEKVGPAFD